MKILQKLYYSLAIILSLTSCSDEGIDSGEFLENKELAAKTILNVSYGQDYAQKYDIYLPANRSTNSTKVLVFVHGGGWIQGDKSDMQDFIPLLEQNHPGYAIVNLNYRLAQPPLRAAFPNQFLDLQVALEHISENAEEYGIDEEFGLIGVSAGGHLSLQFDSVYDLQDVVKFVCSIVGPTNLTDPYYKGNPEFNLALGLLIDENSYPGISDFAKAVSPAHLVNENNSATILFYGEQDPLVPVSNGTFLKYQLDAVGVENSLTVYKGGHGEWSDRANAHLQLELSNFIDRHLPMEF